MSNSFYLECESFRFYVWGCYSRKSSLKENLFSDSNVSSYIANEDEKELYCLNNEVIAFNLEKAIWEKFTTEGDIPCPRSGQAAVLVGNELFMFGGRSTKRRMNDMHKLNMLTRKWSILFNDSEKKNKPVGRSWHSLSYFHKSNFLFLHGGLSFEGMPLGNYFR